MLVVNLSVTNGLCARDTTPTTGKLSLFSVDRLHWHTEAGLLRKNAPPPADQLTVEIGFMHAARIAGIGPTRGEPESVQIKLLVIALAKLRILFVLDHPEVPDVELIHLGTHEAAERVFRGADDRLATDIE